MRTLPIGLPSESTIGVLTPAMRTQRVSWQLTRTNAGLSHPLGCPRCTGDSAAAPFIRWPMSAFDIYIARVLGHEGGYVNNPSDPGGETQWGISKRSYPTVNIRELTREGAIGIYRRDFWNRVHGDQLPPAFAFQALDSAVNHGIETTVRWMQRAAGVADDGLFGPVTLAAIGSTNPADLVLLFLAERLDFYTRLSTFAVFGRGWIRRVAQNLRYAAKDN